MNPKRVKSKVPAEHVVKDLRRTTRKQCSAGEFRAYALKLVPNGEEHVVYVHAGRLA